MRTIKIIVVEDEVLIAESIRSSLEKNDYFVPAIVSDGLEALEKCRKIRPDLVIMDVFIEGKIDGIEAAKRIREQFDIPVIYLTAYADNKTLQDAALTEPYGYIVKPFEDRELFATVEIALYKIKEERRIKESERYYRTVMKSSLDMIITADKYRKIVEFNRSAEQVLGFSRQQIIGKDLRSIFANNVDFFNFYEDTMKKEKHTCEMFLRRKNGEVFQCFLSSAILREGKGKVEGVMIISREITELKKSEQELKELKKAVETIRLGVTITDINGKIFYTNPADAAMHGYSVKELIGKRATVFAPGNLKKTASIEQIKKWKGLIRESRNIRKDGTIFPVWLISSVVKDENNKPTAIITTCEDITERKEMEKHLMRSERMAGVGKLSAGIAHEIRNPLGNISSSAQFCLSKYELQPTVKQYLEIIQRNSEHANKIIEDLLNFANPRGISVDKKNINQVIEQSLQLVKGRSSSKEIVFEKSFSNDLPDLNIDKKWMEQVFLNLLLNAIDASDTGSVITIKTVLNTDDQIEIIFEDSGDGIDADQMKMIFDPFYTTKDDGVGLGLSVVHQIITSHKGKLSVTSEKHKGTQVKITLPILSSSQLE